MKTNKNRSKSSCRIF